MAFDITSVLRGVSGPNTEQIEYLPLDSLLPDPNNFYSLDGLDELAGNIETIGLQQPLRVRPGEEPETWIIVSGHRRRAAIMLIRDGGSDMFDRGVPCIIERGEASEALQKLRLIYANSATRAMTSADLSKQAEEVEMLLYQLKEEGMEFPGLMRDHVAEACKVSKTKLARLHAIRKNLDPGLLAWFDKGDLSESSAYELQKLPAGAQTLIAERCEKLGKANWFYSWSAEVAAKNIELYMHPKTGNTCGGNCTHREERFLQALNTYNPCEGGCCLTCRRMEACGLPCARADEKRKKAKAESKFNAEETEKRRKEAEAAEQAQRKADRQATAQRVLPLIEKAGLADSVEMPAYYGWNKGPTVASLRKQAAGDFGTDHYYRGDNLLPDSVERLSQWADMLGCSLDYLAGRSETPEAKTGAAAEPQWKTGTPTELGDYTVRSGIPDEEGPKTSTYRIIHWNGEGWSWIGTGVPFADNVYRWVKLPEV